MHWPFSNRPDVATFTSKDVVEGAWIHYVSHDKEDGAWQFLSENGAPSAESDARIVLLKNIVQLDPSIEKLADLPLGWIAWRNTKEGEWKRRPKEQ